MKIFVTGASGFLGCRIVQLLADQRLERGIESIHVFGRTYSSFDELQPLIDENFVKVYRGSFKDIESIVSACEDCQIIIHSAALASDWGHPQDFVDSNVEAVEHLCRAALQIRTTLVRFVHISTNDVYGYPPGGMGDENVPMHDNGIPYITTKIKGEEIVHSYIQHHQLPAIILRPSNIYGPRGGSFVPVGLVLGQEKYWLGMCDYPGGLVYVDHVANATILAAFADSSKNGQIYNVSDEPKHTWQQYFDEIARAVGIPLRPRRYWRVPFRVSYFLGWIFEKVRHMMERIDDESLNLVASICGPNAQVYHFFGWYHDTPPFTRHMSLMTGIDGSCDTTKVRRELGYKEIVPFSSAVAASVAWYLNSRISANNNTISREKQI